MIRYTDKDGNNYMEDETIVKRIHTHNTDFEGRITKASYEASAFIEDWNRVREAEPGTWEDAVGAFYQESSLHFTAFTPEAATAIVRGTDKLLLLKQVPEARLMAIQTVLEWLQKTKKASEIVKDIRELKKDMGWEDYSESGDNKAVDVIMESLRQQACIEATEIGWMDFSKALNRAFPTLVRSLNSGRN